MLSYFTVWSNILVGVTAYLLWRNPVRADTGFAVFRLASLYMITITWLVYAFVLAPLWSPTGWQRVADETLHYTVPVLAVVSYLVVGPRPRFSMRMLWSSTGDPAHLHRLHTGAQPVHHIHAGRRDQALVPVPLHQRR